MQPNIYTAHRGQLAVVKTVLHDRIAGSGIDSSLHAFFFQVFR